MPPVSKRKFNSKNPPVSCIIVGFSWRKVTDEEGGTGMEFLIVDAVLRPDCSLTNEARLIYEVILETFLFSYHKFLEHYQKWGW